MTMLFRLAVFASSLLGLIVASPQLHAQQNSNGAVVLTDRERDRREEILSILTIIAEQGPLKDFPPEDTEFSRDELAAIPAELLSRVDGFLDDSEALREAVAAFEAVFQSEGLRVQVLPVRDSTRIWFLPVSGDGWLPYWDGWLKTSSDQLSANYAYLARVNLLTGEVMLAPPPDVRGLRGRWQRQRGVIEHHWTSEGP